jgi:hypothetical protein
VELAGAHLPARQAAQRGGELVGREQRPRHRSPP